MHLKYLQSCSGGLGSPTSALADAAPAGRSTANARNHGNNSNYLNEKRRRCRRSRKRVVQWRLQSYGLISTTPPFGLGFLARHHVTTVIKEVWAGLKRSEEVEMWRY